MREEALAKTESSYERQERAEQDKAKQEALENLNNYFKTLL